MRIGTSLSSLSMEMLDPRRARKNEAQEPFVRTLTPEEVAVRQKNQTLANANRDVEKTSETDSFFLKFTEYRGTRAAQSMVKMARIVDGSTDEHVLTGNSSPGMDELQRQDADDALAPGDMAAIFAEGQAGRPMTDSEIAAVVEAGERNAQGDEEAAKDVE